MGEKYSLFEGSKTVKKGRALVENIRRWSIWFDDGSEDGILVASDMFQGHAELVLGLLNAHAARVARVAETKGQTEKVWSSCKCGYPAKDQEDLDDHVVYMAGIDDDEEHGER